MSFLLEPVPHKEAVAFIKSKPAVSRAVFDRLLPELKARAFTVTGIEDATVLQGIRDRIAELPAGGNWEEIKEDLIENISPFLAKGDTPEDAARANVAATRRAELLLRLHGFQAYSAAAYQVMDAQRDVFPYWEYRSMNDQKVRDTHAALNGMVLPADSKFWEKHYPPWQWGCRCQVVPLTEEDVEELRAADAARPLDERRVLEGEALRQIEEQGRLVKGPNQIFDLRTPGEKGQPGAFEWSPADLRIPLAGLRERYDAEVFAKFVEWARGVPLDATGETVWDWASGDKAWSLLHQSKVEPEAAAGVLKTAPEGHPVVEAVRAWGDDREAFAALMNEDTEIAVRWRAIISKLLEALAPLKDAPTVYRGWKDKEALRQLVEDIWQQTRLGMSASQSESIAEGRFLAGQGMLWEIRNTSTARDLSPIFEALGTRYAYEREVVFPMGSQFAVQSIIEKPVANHGLVPYIVLEEIK